MSNILVINQPLNNRGDESAHKALIRTLACRFPSYHIRVLWVGENEDSIHQFSVNVPNVKYINIQRIKAYNFVASWGLRHNIPWIWYLHPNILEIMKIYKNSDLIVCAPGGICMGGFQNWIHLFLLKMAKYMNKPLIYYGRSFGPFPVKTSLNRKFKKISLEMLHYFCFLSIRDYQTEILAKNLNLKYVQTVDTAFLESPKVELPNEIRNLLQGKRIVVFVPNLLIWHFAYKGLISREQVLSFYHDIYNIIVRKFTDHIIVMLPQTFNYKTYEGDDVNFFNELKYEIDDNKLVVMPDVYSSDIQQTIVSMSDCMIGARYHSVVFAINNAIPFIALSYEHKIAGLLETLEKSDSMVDISGKRLLTNESREEILLEFSEKIKHAAPDLKAQQKAKNIARNCFDNFAIKIDEIARKLQK